MGLSRSLTFPGKLAGVKLVGSACFYGTNPGVFRSRRLLSALGVDLGDLLGRWRSCHCLLTLAGGARWRVLDGSAALRRGALAGVGARALAGLGPLLPSGSFSGKRLVIRCGCCFPVDLVGTDKGILLVAGDRDDAYRAWHLEHVVGVVRGCHELGERWTAENSIVRQWKIGNVKSDPLCPEIQLAAKCY